ncbi:putative D-glutamate cyclase [Paratrimastix pyriformis]|uniref:D-glutamate cyclase n=1 Tax=Paratrimastix pyriformis TaxID=342808 RepID=A0ABQ8U7G2_9EUKA|nr:putative D-glutamate cyclase [Paratrimastix pyriformis]
MSVYDRLLKVVQKDPGNRGITGTFDISGEDVVRFARAIMSSDHVVIATGFFITGANAPETDGPLGSLALCDALQRLGKSVTILTDANDAPLLTKCCASYPGGVVTVDTLPVLPHSANPALLTTLERQTARNYLLQLYERKCGSSGKRLFLLGLERLGRTAVGNHCNMRGVEISELSGGPAIDAVFRYAHAAWEDADHEALGGRLDADDETTKRLFGEVATGGIGDGGNELGMGRYHDIIVGHVPNGALLATTTRTAHVIACGVSNWGGYLLADVMALLARDAALAVRPQAQRDLLAKIVGWGAVDGVTKQNAPSIDGMPFETVHQQLIQEMEGIVTSELIPQNN